MPGRKPKKSETVTIDISNGRRRGHSCPLKDDMPDLRRRVADEVLNFRRLCQESPEAADRVRKMGKRFFIHLCWFRALETATNSELAYALNRVGDRETNISASRVILAAVERLRTLPPNENGCELLKV
jgi:hypothetical protein